MTALRQTVDLSAFPDLVVLYLGMRVNVLRGIKTLLGFGPKIQDSVVAEPDGLLLHENLIYSFFPPHFGMRQYWRDFELDALRTASELVEAIFAGYRWDRLLARTLSRSWRL